VRALVGKLGIPTTLAAFGLVRAQLPGMIANGLAVARLAKAYPGPDVAAAYAGIVNNAFEGKLSGDAD
jgi:alcohol dehydrogenase